MTNSSFGITPQRQRRDQQLQPETPLDPGAPAQPIHEQYQKGGSLLDHSSFQPDRAAAKAINDIKAILDKEKGQWTQNVNLQFDLWKIGAQERAQERLESENFFNSQANVFQAGQANAQITKKLEKDGRPDLAVQNRNSFNWTDFYYWDAKATEVGRNVAITLKDELTKDLSYIAELPETERGSYIQERANAHLQGNENIPRAFKRAKIDPFIANVAFEIKKDAVERKRLFVVNKDKATARTQLLGNLVTASNLDKAIGTNDYDVDLARKAFMDHRRYLINERGYSAQDATEFLAELIKGDQLFIDANGDYLNDIGLHANYRTLIAALEDVQLEDGQKLLDVNTLSDGSIRTLLNKAQGRAQQLYEARSQQYLKKMTREKNDMKNDVNSGAFEWRKAKPDATDADIAKQKGAERAKLIEKNESYEEPPFTIKEIDDFLDKVYPFKDGATTPDDLKQTLLGRAKGLISAGILEIPDDLAKAWKVPDGSGRNYDVAHEIAGLFHEARAKRIGERQAAIDTNIQSDLTNLEANIKTFLTDEEGPQRRIAAGGETRESVERAVDAAKVSMTPQLRRDFTVRLRKEYTDAIFRGEDITKEENKGKIYSRALNQLKESPFYSRLDTWEADTTTGRMRDVPKAGRVELGYDAYQTVRSGRGSLKVIPAKPHLIDIRWRDNGRSYADTLSGKFGDDKEGYIEEVLTKTFVLKQSTIDEYTKLLNWDTEQELPAISQAAREELYNLTTVATNGAVLPWEGLAAQIALYEGDTEYAKRNLDPDQLRNRLQVLGSLTNGVNALDVNPDTDDITRKSYTAIPITQNIHGGVNYAMDFTIQSGNDLQYGNFVQSPVSGTVVASGNEEGGFGNYIVIRAERDSPFNKAGDLIRIAQFASTSANVGDKVSRGQRVGLQGDSSEVNSVEGKSTTGGATPGHLHMQVYKPGDEVDPTYESQYSQDYQKIFFDGMYSSLLGTR